MRGACLAGDVTTRLRAVPEGSVHACITSPPYFGLRSYLPAGHPDKAAELGAEDTPAEYVARMVGVFELVRRALHPSGSLFLNLGDTYAHDKKWGGRSGGRQAHLAARGRERKRTGLTGKNLVGIPWMVAFALRDAGWTLRAEYIWHKPNAMPHPVGDRFYANHETVFHLTKSRRSFLDKFAVMTRSKFQASGNSRRARDENPNGRTDHLATKFPWTGAMSHLRSVWTIPVARSKYGHFAVMPHRLAERCVLAGTSAHGCCPACRAPWVRELKKTRVPTRPGVNTKLTEAERVAREAAAGAGLDWNRANVVGNRDPQRHVTHVEHIGWRPGCNCGSPARCSTRSPGPGPRW